MRPVVVYSLLRVGMFGLALAGMLALGARGLLAALLAAIVSFGLSFVLLRRQRDEVTIAILDRRARRRDGAGVLAADAAAEDADVERAAREAHRPDGPGGTA